MGKGGRAVDIGRKEKREGVEGPGRGGPRERWAAAGGQGRRRAVVGEGEVAG